MSATVADVLRDDARWCVVEGDALALLASLPDGCVDHVICDPPYDARTHNNVTTTRGNWSKGGRLGRGEIRSITIDFDPIDPSAIVSLLLRACRRWVIAFCAVEQIGDYARAAGTAWVRAGVWDRVAPTPSLHGDRPAQRVEGVAVMHRRGVERMRWNGKGGHAYWRHIRLASAHGHDRTGHPTEKPLPLMRELVRDFTDPGDVILDPFAGSGTTGVAALAEGRRVILCERVPEYAEIARRRCEAAAQGTDWRADPRQLSLLKGAP